MFWWLDFDFHNEFSYQRLHRKSVIMADAPEVVDLNIHVLVLQNMENPLLFLSILGSANPGILAAIDTTALAKAFLNNSDWIQSKY